MFKKQLTDLSRWDMSKETLRVSHFFCFVYIQRDLAWYAEFLLELDLKILLRKTGTRLIFKIILLFLHIDPEPEQQG
jgi:hypothetical protein